MGVAPQVSEAMESSVADHDELTSVLDRCNRDRVANVLGATPQKWTGEGEGSAAVLVPLVTAEEGPSVLFTLRSRHTSRHRNQVRYGASIEYCLCLAVESLHLSSYRKLHRPLQLA